MTMPTQMTNTWDDDINVSENNLGDTENNKFPAQKEGNEKNYCISNRFYRK
jgi:hypothetical protein